MKITYYFTIRHAMKLTNYRLLVNLILIRGTIRIKTFWHMLMKRFWIYLPLIWYRGSTNRGLWDVWESSIHSSWVHCLPWHNYRILYLSYEFYINKNWNKCYSWRNCIYSYHKYDMYIPWSNDRTCSNCYFHINVRSN